MRKSATILTILTLSLALFSCGQKAGEPAAPPDSGAAVKTESSAPADAAYDCQYFGLSLASGWEASPEKFGMVNVLPKGQVSPGLYFKFEGAGNALGTAEASIESMIRNYGGSPMESTTIAGVEFKTTTYTYQNMTQTMHVAFRSGTKVTITIEGVGAKDNPDIKSMLATFAVK